MNKRVPVAEKLTVLREADSIRHWNSLDDRRVCVLCDRLITGRMIDIWQDDHGGYHFHCPTSGCPATPRDWFYHGPVAATGSDQRARPEEMLGVARSYAS